MFNKIILSLFKNIIFHCNKKKLLKKKDLTNSTHFLFIKGLLK